MSIATPWGRSQGIVPTSVAGIDFVHTSSHGGYWVSSEHADSMADHVGVCTGAGIPDETRGGTWWEEDCAWAFVAKAFPDAFPSEAQDVADRTISMLQEWKKR